MCGSVEHFKKDCPELQKSMGKVCYHALLPDIM